MDPTLKRLQIARTNLLLDQPFFGVLALHLEQEIQDGVGTACTDGRRIKWDPKFVAGLANDELLAVMAHEVMHCACGHPWRRDLREPMRWNIACVAAHTPILMADGTQKPIGLVRPSEYICSPYGPSRVLASVFSGVRSTLELDVDGNLLYATPEHRIFTDEGFIHAESIDNSKQGWVLRSRASKGARDKELPNTKHEEIINRDRNLVHINLAILEKARVTSEAGKAESQTCQLRTAEAPDFRTMGVSSRVGGWRRQHFNQQTWEVLSAKNSYNEHILSSLQVLKESGVFGRYSKEQHQSSLLATSYHWLPDGRAIAWDSAFFSNKEDSRHAIAALYQHASSTELSRNSDSRDVRHLAENQGTERTRIQVREGTSSFPVFDLVTEHHCYYANGVLVHNCDFAINEILEKAGFKMPKNALRDSQYDGKSAEWIYDRIKVEYIKVSGRGGQGDPGGMGGVEDAGGAGKEDGPTEADWQQNVQQSLNAAKAQGKLPANLARMLGDLTKARVDWRSLLRRYIQEVVKADYTWTRPNVRYIPSGLFLPALHSEACGRIVCAIDTSGSIDDVLLNQFASEVQAIAFELEPSSIEVVYCDAAIQRVDEFTRGDAITMKAAGGGGTSFRPVFERYKNDPPVVLVYLTDMMGDFPSEVPEYPVIWASTGHDEAPFGDVVVCQ